MSLDSDVAVLGTGVAALIATIQLIHEGRSVLLLNPDWDFFLENSELPFDPLLQGPITPERLRKSTAEHALAELRPLFPGPIEFWSDLSQSQAGYHDPDAPHIRSRGRLWISSIDKDKLWNWEALENLYVETSDAGLNPQILEGLAAVKKFPGYTSTSTTSKGLYVPKLCDVDVTRYRNGLLEFVRERLGDERALCNVHPVEWMPDGIRFYSNGVPHTARISDGMLAFWTPRMTNWVMTQSKKFQKTPSLPRGLRLWEQWTLHSRDKPETHMIGMFGDMAVWGEFEGSPDTESRLDRLAVLRPGPLLPQTATTLMQSEGLNWASADSFQMLAALCQDFLKWDRFAIRSFSPRVLFEWENPESWLLTESHPPVWVIPGCDGPLIDVAHTTRTMCEKTLGEK